MVKRTNRRFSFLCLFPIVFALLCGCAEKFGPNMTLLDFPQGLPVSLEGDSSDQEKAINKILQSERFKSLFSYYVADNGRIQDVQDLGLLVEGWRGTLSPVNLEQYEVLVRSHLSASGSIEFQPVVSFTGSYEAGEYYLLNINGKAVQFTPRYTLTVNPINPVIPDGFIQQVYYADNISANEISAYKFTLNAKGQLPDLKALKLQGQVNDETVKAFAQRYSKAIFGNFQVGKGKWSKAIDLESTEISLGPSGKSNLRFGNNFQVVHVRNLRNDDTIDVSFLGKDYTDVKLGSWININNEKAVIHYKDINKRANPVKVHLTLMQFTEDFQKGFGSPVRFQKYDNPKKVQNNCDDLFARGSKQLSQERYAAALDIFEDVLKRCPNYDSVWRNLGEAKFKIGRYDDALKYFKKADELEPNSRHNKANLAAAHLGLNNPSKAIELLMPLIKENPAVVRYRYNLGLAYQLQHNFSKMKDEYEFVIDQSFSGEKADSAAFNLAAAYAERSQTCDDDYSKKSFELLKKSLHFSVNNTEKRLRMIKGSYPDKIGNALSRLRQCQQMKLLIEEFKI